MLKSRIKASQITNLTDARYFAAWDVNWLGFNFEKGNDHYIAPQNMIAIKEWVEGPKFVGTFNMQDASEILESVKILGLDAVQLGMFATKELVQSLTDITIFKEIVVEQNSDIESIEKTMADLADDVSYFILNFNKNGISYQMLKSGKSLPLDQLKNLFETYPIILSIDNESNELDDLLETLQPYGLDLSGGEEEKVGLKSFDELDDIFEALETFE